METKNSLNTKRKNNNNLGKKKILKLHFNHDKVQGNVEQMMNKGK